MTRYEIEKLTNEIARNVANEYNLENDFYGDCFPEEVMNLEDAIQRSHNQDEILQYFEEIEEIFKYYAEDYIQYTETQES